MNDNKTVKLENLRPLEYTVNYPTPDNGYKPYVWKAAHNDRTAILEVPLEVYDYIRYETSTFQNGFLVLAKDENDEKIIAEVEEVSDDIKVYSTEEIKKILNGTIQKLKSILNEKTPTATVMDFVRVANEIKLDSESKKNYLATILGYKDNKEFLFPSIEG